MFTPLTPEQLEEWVQSEGGEIQLKFDGPTGEPHNVSLTAASMAQLCVDLQAREGTGDEQVYCEWDAAWEEETLWCEILTPEMVEAINNPEPVTARVTE